jgi:lambda family phage tail tape measure protein
MADISVIVDYSSVKAANEALEQTGTTALKSAKVFEAAFKSAEAQSKKSLKSVRDQIAFSKRMEAQKAKEAKVLQASATKSAAEEERLRTKFVAGHAAMNIYSRELDELARARRLDIISAKQQAAAVDSLNKDFKEGTGIFANYASGVMKGANRMGVAMQQTGYQVGDFLVQVQSGTNPMVAFGQQATQLVGVMYLLPQATLAAKVGFMGLQMSMGAIVAVVSILIPLATAIGAYFLRSGKEAKEGAEGIDVYAEALGRLESRLKNLTEERLSATTQFDPDILQASQKRLELANLIAEKEIESLSFTGEKKEFVDNLIASYKEELAAETKKIEMISSRIRKEEEAAAARKKAEEEEAAKAKAILDKEKARLAILNRQKNARREIYKEIAREGQAADRLGMAEGRRALVIKLNLEREAKLKALEDAGLARDSEAMQIVYDRITATQAHTLAIYDRAEAEKQAAKEKAAADKKALEDAAAKKKAELEAAKAAHDALKKTRDLANTVGSSMETAMMSMVDGTKSVKDAFRDMALDIVKHLYKVLVVQRMINAIGGMIGGPVGSALSTYGQADGGAWQGGSQIQAYADGGIVGSPTTFPMANGKTGLMGEAGPEAIMPLKRGANGKLGVQMEGGGGDTINVVQNFSFQANGDDSVKKIIAQAAPQIANMTKKSMLDDRRRGGTTKAVFG